MNEVEELSNPERYKIFIQIKKNRRLKRKAKYLNAEFEFIEDIKQALEFPDIQSAEDILSIISSVKSNETRPRIIIKFLIPPVKKQTEVKCGG